MVRILFCIYIWCRAEQEKSTYTSYYAGEKKTVGERERENDVKCKKYIYLPTFMCHKKSQGIINIYHCQLEPQS